MKLRTLPAVLATLAVTGCSTSEAQPPPPTTSTMPAKSTLPRLDVAAEPTWTSNAVSDAQLRDGTALVTGQQTFRVIDTATGDVRWEADSETDLGGGVSWDAGLGTPHLVGEGRDLAVVSAYYSPANSKIGIGLFSAEDGRPLWRTTIGAGADLRVADGRTVLVSVTENGPPVQQSDLRMLALDTRTGDKLWERTGTYPTAIAGDIVLGTNTLDDDDSSLTVNVDGEVAAFDAATGKPRWDLGSRYRGSEVVFAVGDVVVVHATESTEEEAEVVLVATETGEEVANLGVEDAALCDTDHDTTIACFFNGKSVAVFRLSDQEVTRVAVDDTFEGVGQNRIFLGGVDGHYAVDLAGRKIDEQLPGAPIIVTDDYLVVGDDDPERTEVAGYRHG